MVIPGPILILILILELIPEQEPPILELILMVAMVAMAIIPACRCPPCP